MSALWKIIRGITNIICFLGILSGLRFIAFGLGATFFGAWGLLIVIYGVIKVCVYAFMIYLIGETDRYPAIAMFAPSVCHEVRPI